MCGIAGMFAPDGGVRVDSLEAMNTCLAHRGPDDDGIYTDAQVGLAHRRLSIIDLKNGQQPIFNENNTIVTIFNGEIYNYQQLRDSLVKAGHDFSSNSDTEVLVHLYEEYGPSFLRKINGMFAFALWDKERERLLLARDPLGIKPLYIGNSNDQVVFASELTAILESTFRHGTLDETALEQYFGLGFIPSPRTAFKNISKLSPGELAIISENGIQRRQYYSPSIRANQPDFSTAMSELRSRVFSSVKSRLQSDVPLGAFLSGGIDSSIIVGTMAKLLDEPVKTFTVGFDDDVFDESRAAHEVANYHNTDHNEFSVSADDVRDLIPEVLGKLGEPFGDPSLLPTYVVARETSNHVKVALSGDGADELFAGYDRYRAEYYSRYFRPLPSPIQSGIKHGVYSLPASRANRFTETVNKMQEFVDSGTETDFVNRHFAWRCIPPSGQWQIYNGVNPTEAGLHAYRNQHELIRDRISNEALDGRDEFRLIQLVDTGFSLPNKILHKVDLASMYNSLEVRVPMLDTSVVEYALSLPTKYKITAWKRKKILKEAFHDIIPPKISNRNKQGFDMPIGEWFKNELNEEFKTTISSTESSLLNEGQIIDLLEKHTYSNRDYTGILWNIYVFKTWLKTMRDRGYL